MKYSGRLAKAVSLIAVTAVIFTAAVQVSAVTVPVLAVTSYDYEGPGRVVDDEITKIGAGEELQLYAIVKYGNEMGPSPGDNGWFVDSVLTEGLTWKSGDEDVATVDKNGKVTGTGAGTTVITVTPDSELYKDHQFYYSVSDHDASFEITVTANGVPFADVAGTSWYCANVRFVSEKGLMNGVSRRNFSPDGDLTRAMTATVIWRMLGEPEAGDVKQFSDVEEDTWFSDAVLWAKELGVVKGVSATRFDPYSSVTRADFAVMIHRCVKLLGVTLTEPENTAGSPSDIGAVPSYAKDAVTELFRAGIVNGRGDGIFDPGARITRAEAAAMLERSYNAIGISDVQKNGAVIRCGYSETEGIYTFHSTEEVKSFIAAHSVNFENGSRQAAEKLEEFDSAFFLGNTLAVGFVTATSGSVQYFFDTVAEGADRYSVNVTSKGPGPGEYGTCDMATWCVIAPIPAKGVSSSAVTLCVNSRPVTEPASYGTVSGYRYRIIASIDSMPSTGKKIPDLTVTVTRIEKTGGPVGDIGIILVTDNGTAELVRDTGLDRNDSCTFRLAKDSWDLLWPYNTQYITGELYFACSEGTELVPFGVTISKLDYM